LLSYSARVGALLVLVFALCAGVGVLVGVLAAFTLAVVFRLAGCSHPTIVSAIIPPAIKAAILNLICKPPLVCSEGKFGKHTNASKHATEHC
jgi:hypothetical protein